MKQIKLDEYDKAFILFCKGHYLPSERRDTLTGMNSKDYLYGVKRLYQWRGGMNGIEDATSWNIFNCLRDLCFKILEPHQCEQLEQDIFRMCLVGDVIYSPQIRPTRKRLMDSAITKLISRIMLSRTGNMELGEADPEIQEMLWPTKETETV